MNIYLHNWEIETRLLAHEFKNKYFGNIEQSDCHFIADEIGGVFAINDYFFSLNDMVEFIRYRYSKEKMFKYYEYAAKEFTEDMTPINIKNWKKLK